MTQLAGRVLSKMQNYFEVMLKLFAISYKKERKDIDLPVLSGLVISDLGSEITDSRFGLDC